MLEIRDNETGKIVYRFKLPDGMTYDEAERHIKMKPLIGGDWQHRRTDFGGEFYRIDDDGIEVIKPYKA
jgi:hypothetical protein